MKKYKKYLIFILITMGSQALIYFLIKLFINDYNIINSFLDVPLIRPFIFIYDSWYPFIILITFIIYKHNKNLFYILISTMLFSAFISQITFIAYPSMITRPTIEVHNLTDWLLDFTYKADTPAVNCLPSMHCIYCFITGFYILKCKEVSSKIRFSIITYSFLIVLSTLFTKQHIIEDVLLAIIYTIISITVIYLNKERIIKIFNKLKI